MMTIEGSQLLVIEDWDKLCDRGKVVGQGFMIIMIPVSASRNSANQNLVEPSKLAVLLHLKKIGVGYRQSGHTFDFVSFFSF